MGPGRSGSDVRGAHNTPGIREPSRPKPPVTPISRVVGPNHNYETRSESNSQAQLNDRRPSVLLPGSPNSPSFSNKCQTPDQSHGVRKPSFDVDEPKETSRKKSKQSTGNKDEVTQRNSNPDISGTGPDYDDQSSTLTTPAYLFPVQGRLTRSATKRLAENEGASKENVDSHSMPDVQRSLKRRRAAREEWRDTQLPSPLSRSTNPGQAENGVESPVFDNPSSPYITPATPGPAEYSDEPPEYQSPSSPDITPGGFEEEAGEDYTYYDDQTYDDHTYVGEAASENHLRFIMEVSVPIPSNLGKRPRGSWDQW